MELLNRSEKKMMLLGDLRLEMGDREGTEDGKKMGEPLWLFSCVMLVRSFSLFTL